jgi:hypothetical protein
MKPNSPPSRSAAGKAQADAEAAKLWHPTLVEFSRGVEVTEVVDSIPGELLELFKPAPPAGSV